MRPEALIRLLFPIIVLIIAAARANARAKQGSGDLLTPPAARPPAESEVERQRRFREALGLPAGTQVPPPVRPRTVTNPPPLQPINPPLRGAFPSPGRLRRIDTGMPPKAGTPPVQPTTRSVTTPPPVPAPVPGVFAAPAKSPVAPPPAPAIAVPPARRPLASTAPVTPAPAAQAPSPVSALLLRLRDPDSIRQAIILREILGPPKALQPIAAGPAAPWMGR